MQLNLPPTLSIHLAAEFNVWVLPRSLLLVGDKLTNIRFYLHKLGSLKEWFHFTMDSRKGTSGEGNYPMLEEKQIVKELHPSERARILRKIDWHLLPFVSLFYLMSFL